MSRGRRNNNPLNIRRTKDKWKGMSDIQSDSAFVQFDHVIYGFRAAFRIIKNNISSCNTIRKIITRWAPPTENFTKDYIKFVSQRLGYNPDAIISYSDIDLMVELVYSLAYYESAFWFDRTEIRIAYDLEKV